MPLRTTTISIGSALRRTNRRFERASWDDLKRYLDALEASASIVGPAREHGPIETQGHVEHHDEFAGNGPGSYFPQIDAGLKNDVMRAAVIQSIRLALYQTFAGDGSGIEPRSKPLPIVTYWITCAESPDVFEAYVDVTSSEVHVFLVTPDPAPTFTPPDPAAAFDEQMWVCASPARVQAIRERAPDFDYRAPVAMPSQLSAVCQQVKGY